MNISPLVVFGIPASVIIVAIIEALKRGWPHFFGQAKVAVITAIILGLVCAAVVTLLGSDYSAPTITLNAIAGLLAGLGAVGVYDVARATGYKSVNLDGSTQKT